MTDSNQHVTETSVDDLNTTEAVDPTDVSPYEEGQNRVASQRISVFGTLGYDDEPDQGGVYDDFPAKNLEQGDAYDVLPQRTSDVYQDTYQTTSPVYEVYEEGKKEREKEKPEPKYVKLTFAKQIFLGIISVVATLASIISLVMVGVWLAGINSDLDNVRNKSSNVELFYHGLNVSAEASRVAEIKNEISSLNDIIQITTSDLVSMNNTAQTFDLSLQSLKHVLNEANATFQLVVDGLVEVRDGAAQRQISLNDAQEWLNSTEVKLNGTIKRISPLEDSVENLENN